MKKKITLAAVLIFTIFSIFAACEKKEKLNNYSETELAYIVDKEEGAITIIGRGTCTSADIVIPNELEGYPVRHIATNAFLDATNLKSISIPDSVVSIGDNAFDHCSNLKYNEIDNIYYLGNKENPYLVLVGAKSNSITSCIIPKTTKVIYDSAFYHCSNLTCIEIPNNITNIGSLTFSDCTSLTNITFERSSKLMSVGDDVFYNCSNLKYNEIDNIYYLGSEDSPCLILVQATENYSFNSFTVPETTRVIYTGAFAYCPKLINILIGNNVLCIGGGAFQNCNNLTSVTIGNNVKTIGSSAFSDCSNLTSLSLGNCVKTIGSKAFYNCSSLTSIEIPSSIMNSGEYAFFGCSHLTNVYIADLGKWCDISFDDEYANPIACANKFYTKNEFNEYKLVTKLVIPKGVTDIRAGVFQDCNNLTSVTIPNSVVSIGSSAFLGCSDLESVSIGNSVKWIGKYSFSGCNSLRTINIPNSVTTIQRDAFSGCFSLTSVTIPKSVTYIGKYAFYGCINLNNITFSNTSEWYAKKDGARSDIKISVTNASNNATYFKSTYCDYNWYRK